MIAVSPRSRGSAAAVALLVGLLVGAALAAPARAGSKKATRLVPANLGPKTDALGFAWDITQQGSVDDGTNDCFDGGLLLMVNGQRFNAQRPMMTADGSELVLSATLSPVEVTRRIKVDQAESAVRYVEVFENKSRAPASFSVTIMSQLGGSARAVLSETGAPSPMALGAKDGAVLAVQHPGGRPSVLFCVADPKSKLKPTLSVQNQRTFNFTYALSVRPGGSVSVLHTVAQRNLTVAPDPKALVGMLKPFRSRKWTRDLPAAVRRSIANSRRFGYGTNTPDLLTLLEGMGVPRGSVDLLAVGEETRLRGTASCARPLVVETRFGPVSVPFEKVAAAVGKGHPSRRVRVFLRDGQVFGGRIAAKDLRFVMNSGLALDLDMESLDRLVLHAREDDGKPGEGVYAFLETTEGDCLALARAPAELELATAWGPRRVGLDELHLLGPPESGAPGHVVRLKDHSRFFAYLDGPPVKLQTIAFGLQEVAPSAIRGIRVVSETPAAVALDELGEPHVVLAGENLLVGRVDLDALHFRTGSGVIPVPPGQVRSMGNVSEEGGDDPVGGPIFHAELWGGDTVTGRLQQLALPVRWRDETCRIPVCDVLNVVVPSPTVPEALRDRIARLIRDLGHPEWKKRDEASRRIAELGYLAKGQLEEAFGQANDPEVRRRVRVLLEELKE